MSYRVGVALAILVVLVGGIVLLRPGPMPAPREADVVSALATHFLGRLGDAPMTSAASDCRTEGATRAALPAALFQAFLAANRNAEPLDLGPFSERHRVLPREVGIASRARHETVVSLSRAGMLENAALVCLEVLGREERGFFVVLRRSPGAPWRVDRELVAWEAPEEPDTGPATEEEPLFLPRPSQLERERRAR